MNTIALDIKDWPLVEADFTRRMGNAMPTDPLRDSFVALFEPGMKAGQVPFLHLETVYHFNCVVVPEEYGYHRRNMALRLIRDAATCIPAGQSAIWLSDRRVDMIASAVGARLVHDQVDGTNRYYVYRKDR